MSINNFQWFLTSIVSTQKINRTRTFGFYKEYSDAMWAVFKNQSNMHECLYDYLVMEKIGEGIHPEVVEEKWFNFDDKLNGWRPCEKPEFAQGTINWALG
jgi:hypothetical protein